MEVATGQRFSGLTECIETSASGDQHRLIFGTGIVNPFDKYLPSLFFMNFVQNEHVGIDRPGMRVDHPGIVEMIVVQVLGSFEIGHERLGKPSLTDLSGTR